MTKETTETSPVRFVHLRSPSSLLAAPLPPRLEAVLPAAERKRHRELVARSEEASRRIGELRREIDQAPARDREAAAQAALAGEAMPEPALDGLRREWEQAQAAKQALDDALRTSADALLVAAVGRADVVAAEIEQELGETTEAIRARIADLRDGLAELGSLFGEAMWTRGLVDAAGQSVRPFRAGGGREFTETLSQLRVAEQALDFELRGIEERRRDRAEQVRVAEAAQRERREASAAGKEER
jgi:hypothetical protein